MYRIPPLVISSLLGKSRRVGVGGRTHLEYNVDPRGGSGRRKRREKNC